MGEAGSRRRAWLVGASPFLVPFFSAAVTRRVARSRALGLVGALPLSSGQFDALPLSSGQHQIQFDALPLSSGQHVLPLSGQFDVVGPCRDLQRRVAPRVCVPLALAHDQWDNAVVTLCVGA